MRIYLGQVHHLNFYEITDVNDHSPAFPEKQQRFEIAEHTLPGKRFQLHTARDPDAGTNSIRTYTLSSNDHFEIDIRQSDDDKIPFLVLKKSLDREKNSKHVLFVTAVDGGKPPRSGTLNVSIVVLDSNDNRPTFSQEIYESEIRENVPVGTSVFRVNATDPDEGTNGEIEYNFGKTLKKKVYDIFELDKLTGEIRVKGLVDYEENNIYKLDIEASDKGTPPLTGECRLIIKIKDVNDNSPEIEVTSLSNTVKEGTVVGNIAKDLGLDVASLIDRRFRVVSESKNVIFEVNQHDGALYVHDHIDREELCQGSGTCLMELKILVEKPLEIHYVVVEITDVNDHSPAFPEKQQRFEIAEHTLPGKRFQLHTARDPDAGTNSIRTYTLTSNEDFEVHIRQSDAGKMPFLVLKRPLDREQKNKHTLLITAVDGGKPPRSGTLNVSIVVLDSNDNRPTFSQEIYESEIRENVPVGTSVFRVNATDPDEGTNGEIEYNFGKTLKKKVYDIFELDKLTGEIRVKGLVDYEENNIYELDIEASDKGTPPLTGECRLIIKIKDVNDNSPEIEVTSLSNTVTEDSKPGTVISLLSVRDKDSGVNGKMISQITNDVPFELKPSYKENIYSVVTKGFLDREQVPHYEIIIKATDCGEPPLSTYKSLNIQISDVNDNSPHFSQNPLQFYLEENNVAGSTIFSVRATDNDLNENAAITYHIMRAMSGNDSPSSFLNINPDNGQNILPRCCTNYDGTLCHSIQYRSGDKRYMLVGPRMSIGSTIVPGSQANTLVLPDRRRTSEEVRT
uniref:Si:ch73-379j16.2 n=1 Tax=Echeneis naucrates TaxID=173247 RepID=A0A665UM89_ECHNA